MTAAQERYDVIVAGSGAGGLAAAVAAAGQGLKVLVLEKTEVIGGTTARSGGVLWVPCNPVSLAAGIDDSEEAARRYLLQETAPHFDARRVDAFLRNGPRMVAWFQEHTSVRFDAIPTLPDYHPLRAGASQGGRSIVAAPCSASTLGDQISLLRPPLRELTFVGMMFNVSREISHFFNCTRSLTSAFYVARRLGQHAIEMILHGRPQRITNGNALVARLLRSALDAGVQIRTNSPVIRLVHNDGSVEAVIVRNGTTTQRIEAHTVILATGGFPQSVDLRKQLFPHAPSGTEHWSPAPEGNVGDGWRLAEEAGAQTVRNLPNAAAWIPVSLVPRKDAPSIFPHLIDRYKPGIIAVTARGRRFVNEADSYHDFGQAVLTCSAKGEPPFAWLVCDHRTIRRYGLGFAKPAPLPLRPHLRSGYLIRGRTLKELATKTGMDAQVFERDVAKYNVGASTGLDPAFGKGASAYNRYLGDPQHTPNPCVAPVERGPFYAVRVRMGDLGTFAGIRTDEHARVLDGSGQPVAGLYAVGNDAASVMGGNYPGAGITLGPAMTFGYTAALHIAASLRSRETRTPQPKMESIEC